ncbi:MAG: hypothetical protein CMJ39_09890 [Phycisphaerae bacterium]|nr:hypothetical protein [Phycisphaerae bacterium]
MTINDMQYNAARAWNRLRRANWSLPGCRMRSLVIEFHAANIGVAPGIEWEFAADQLRKKGPCRTVMTLAAGQLRVDGVPARQVKALSQMAARLGASRCALIV